MVGGESDPDVGEADLVPEESEEVGDLTIEVERHLMHLGSIGTYLMAEDVVGREADGKQVGGRAASNIFVKHELLGELELVLVGEGGRTDHLEKSGVGAVF